MTDPATQATTPLTMEGMQQLLNTQLQIMQLAANNQNQTAPVATAQAASTVRRIPTPAARYDMTSHEFRTYKKDCEDYKKLTGYSDEQTVLQMRINMDSALKQAVDANYSNTWDGLTVTDALKNIETLLKRVVNPVVHRKRFDELKQQGDERFTEFLTRMKMCAADCDFVCPFDPTHNLTEYHMINRIRSGIRDKKLQQELLQQSGTLNTLQLITDHCTNFESAKHDAEKLYTPDSVVGSISHQELDDVSLEEVIAAVSEYRKKKKADNTGNKDLLPPATGKTCGNCGYEWPHAKGKSACPAKHNVCKFCKIKGHFERVCRRKNSKEVSSIIIGAIQRIMSMSTSEKSKLPKLNVTVGHDNEIEKTDVVTDTGAMVTVAGESYLKILKIDEEDLIPPPHDISHVGGKNLEVIGCYPVFITHNNQLVETLNVFH